MKRRNAGLIVNMATILAHVNLPLMGSYCASKAALHSLTQGIRAELLPWGVRVMGVYPGAVDTAMSADFRVRRHTQIRNPSAMSVRMPATMKPMLPMLG